MQQTGWDNYNTGEGTEREEKEEEGENQRGEKTEVGREKQRRGGMKRKKWRKIV